MIYLRFEDSQAARDSTKARLKHLSRARDLSQETNKITELLITAHCAADKTLTGTELQRPYLLRPVFRSPCELLPVGTGHPVQATLKSYTALSGCASRGTTSLPQEVHIINLRGHVPQGPDSNPAE
ncbi:Transforming growth factor beta receptor type 3, partial [Dissostichus eleginoides]